MPSREAWALGFAAQSRSDWQVYGRLAADQQIPACHELHYLQMACETLTALGDYDVITSEVYDP
jgi:hypothetical protein